MALWLVRCGRHGEFEQKYLDDKRIYLTWDKIFKDLSKLEKQAEVVQLLAEAFPDATPAQCSNHGGQLWAFSHRMSSGDLVVVPSKAQPTIHIAEITGDYVYDKKAPERFNHYRTVKWLKLDVPRTAFDQDLLYSFGAIMTICQITRNDAEKRMRAMIEGKKPVSLITHTDPPPDPVVVDLERLARDQIAQMLTRQFMGHGLARLVNAILQAQGYTTYISPPGPDKGIDILAAPGPLGFGQPRLCVQVKSGDSPVDSPTLNQLIGAMQNVQAEQGLLVSWGGFKQTVERERAVQFFKVRFWNQEDVVNELLAHYDKLDEDLRAELPLKRIWTIASQDTE